MARVSEATAIIFGMPPVAEGLAFSLAAVLPDEKPPPPKAEEVKKEPEPEIKEEDQQKGSSELIAMGHGENPYDLQILLNTRGGSVQQVIQTHFMAANRQGLEVVEDVDGKKNVPVPIHLVPGVRIPWIRGKTLREQDELDKIATPKLHAGVVNNLEKLSLSPTSSYTIYHYDKPGDERPLNELGIKNWKVVERSLDPNTDEQKVVFETELGEPHNLVITKTFTLKRHEYHVGLTVDFKRIEGRKGPNQFRYQLKGANGLPIEGEWYTSTYRQAIVGFADDHGRASRYIETAPEIRKTEGGDRQTRDDKRAIRYAAVAVQYFASAIVVDDEQENRNFLEFVRATPVGDTHKDKEFLDDLTVRAISEAFNPDKEITHKYLLYNGPVKVRLLRQMPEGEKVDDALVDRYLDKLNLYTMTDAPMNNVIGRIASTFYWSDLVIAFTNIIHSLLWLLHQFIPSLAVCIMIITVIVRGAMFPVSRRQSQNALVLQEKTAKLAPEMKKIQEKSKDDPHRLHQERLKLYKDHGISPFAALGGCFPLLLQMPIFTGLYFALQESVFFRLESFLWIPNLTAPDMLIHWGESIPIISEPSSLGGTFYLGPYFNILPVIAVSLMLYQQTKMMPKTDDPEKIQQQKMMKFMMIIMALFFYKVAAGLCIYFIMSTLWGITERRLLPKTSTPDGNPAPTKDEDPKAPKQLGWWGRRKALWKEKWQAILEQAQKQAEHQRNEQQQQNPGGNGAAKKKKKKRK